MPPAAPKLLARFKPSVLCKHCKHGAANLYDSSKDDALSIAPASHRRRPRRSGLRRITSALSGTHHMSKDALEDTGWDAASTLTTSWY